MQQFTDTFDQFTKELASRLNIARQTGMGQQELVDKAEDVGDWLARTVPPKSPEQRLLKELWDAGSNQEQKAIASALVKMVSRKSPGIH